MQPDKSQLNIEGDNTDNFTQTQLNTPQVDPLSNFFVSSQAGTLLLQNGQLQSPNYIQNVSGWKVDSQGNADFQQITAKISQSKDLFDYDLRGYWKDEISKDPELVQNPSPILAGDARDHGPDTYKKPNHQTFSEESKYNNTTGPNGEKYVGGRWGENDSFMPSKEMLDNKTHDKEFLKWYFKRFEPDSKLIFPSE